MSKPHLNTDGYKIGHVMLYPYNTETIYETLVPRDNSYFPWDDKMVVFGYQYFVSKLKEDWDENFFERPWDSISEDFEVVRDMFGSDKVYNQVYSNFHMLWLKDYLPIKITALPEGTLAPMRVPVLTIENTDPAFYWLPGYLETTLLANTFVTSTNATTARMFRKIGKKYADLSADSDDYLDFQFHDFSMRGQHGDQAGILSGIAHLTSFTGSDSVSSVNEIWREYGENIGATVLATEHSVMEAYGTDQFKAYKDLIIGNPDGILSIVSDTYDYWEVIDEVLPALKDEIMSRDGKIVIRPDSLAESRNLTPSHKIETIEEQLINTLSSLYANFGGTTNSKGYKVLDPHVGVLHGEGVTLDNVDSILKAITDAGFSAENIVLGVGAYVYSVMSSRDSFGQALKASVAVINGEEKQIFKKPKSEKEAFKQSPKGAVAVVGESGEYTMVQNLTLKESENYPDNKLKVIFKNGRTENVQSFTEIRDTIKSELDK